MSGLPYLHLEPLKRGLGVDEGLSHRGNILLAAVDLLIETGELLVGDPEFTIQGGDVSFRVGHGAAKFSLCFTGPKTALFECRERDRHVVDAHLVQVHVPGHVAGEPEEVAGVHLSLLHDKPERVERFLLFASCDTDGPESDPCLRQRRSIFTGSCGDRTPGLSILLQFGAGPETLPSTYFHDAVSVLQVEGQVGQVTCKSGHLPPIHAGNVSDLRAGEVHVLLRPEVKLRRGRCSTDRRADLPPTRGHVGGGLCGHVGGLFDLLVQLCNLLFDAPDLVPGNPAILGRCSAEIIEPTLRIDEAGLDTIDLAVDTPEFVRYVIDETELNHQRA